MKFAARLSMMCLRIVLVTAQAHRCSAGVWTEMSDAGDLPGTAQVTTGSGDLDGINGTIVHVPLVKKDIDMFGMHIADPDAFSATLFSPGFPVDTYLFLFDSSGVAVIADNDALPLPDPGDPLSEIPVGSLTGLGLAPGDYYLAVSTGVAFGSPFDFDIPFDGSDNLIFDPVDLASDVGPGTVSPSSSEPIDGWQVDVFDVFDEGAYEIQLTGTTFAQSAVVPEPLSLVIWTPALIFAARYRRRKCPASLKRREWIITIVQPKHSLRRQRVTSREGYHARPRVATSKRNGSSPRSAHCTSNARLG